MKWSHYCEAAPSRQLLLWVIECVIRPYNIPLDCWLKDVLKSGGGLGDDPGWEMEHIPFAGGPGMYRLWADTDMSGLEPAEAIYSADEVHHALRESLIAFAEAYPERSNEVLELLTRYRL